MQFSEYERRILAEIEEELTTEDPGLVEMLRTGETRRKPQTIRVLIFSLLPGAVLFTLGLLSQSAALVMTALMVTGLFFYAAVIWCWASKWP